MPTLDREFLKDRDYLIILARSLSQSFAAPPGYRERWSAAEESLGELVALCERYDPDGVTLYIASDPGNDIKQFENLTRHHLQAILSEAEIPSTFFLAPVLSRVFETYLGLKNEGKTKSNGTTILILIDSEPQDRKEVMKSLIQMTQKITSPEEIGICFVQIGENMILQGFLQSLDDNLRSVGAEFDIVDTQILQNIQPDSLIQVLVGAVQD
jgi:hypothetical protein